MEGPSSAAECACLVSSCPRGFLHRCRGIGWCAGELYDADHFDDAAAIRGLLVRECGTRKLRPGDRPRRPRASGRLFEGPAASGGYARQARCRAIRRQRAAVESASGPTASPGGTAGPAKTCLTGSTLRLLKPLL